MPFSKQLPTEITWDDAGCAASDFAAFVNRLTLELIEGGRRG